MSTGGWTKTNWLGSNENLCVLFIRQEWFIWGSLSVHVHIFRPEKRRHQFSENVIPWYFDTFFSINFVPNERMIESMCRWMLTNLKWFNCFIAPHSSLTTPFIGTMFCTNVSLMRASNLIQFCHLDKFSVIVAPNKSHSRDLLWMKSVIFELGRSSKTDHLKIWIKFIDWHALFSYQERTQYNRKTHRIYFHARFTGANHSQFFCVSHDWEFITKLIFWTGHMPAFDKNIRSFGGEESFISNIEQIDNVPISTMLLFNNCAPNSFRFNFILFLVQKIYRWCERLEGTR